MRDLILAAVFALFIGSFSFAQEGSRGQDERSAMPASEVFPNPFQKSITLYVHNPKADEILIFDLVGQPVKSFSLEPGHSRYLLDLSGLPEGIYFYTLVSGVEVIETRRIAKSKF